MCVTDSLANRGHLDERRAHVPAAVGAAPLLVCAVGAVFLARAGHIRIRDRATEDGTGVRDGDGVGALLFARCAGAAKRAHFCAVCVAGAFCGTRSIKWNVRRNRACGVG